MLIESGGVFTVGFAVLVIIPVWRIYQRAGLPPAWSLTLFLPWIGPLVAVGILALATWGSAANFRIFDPGPTDPYDPTGRR